MSDDRQWIQMMAYQESIRLFAGLTIKKAYRGALSSAKEVDALFRIVLSEAAVTPMALSRQMGTPKSLISRLIDSLCKKGLIEKSCCFTDKRSYGLIATDKGRSELDRMYTYYLKPIYTLRENLGEEKFNALGALISEANEIMLSGRKES